MAPVKTGDRSDLIYVGVLCVETTKPCRLAKNAQLISQQSLPPCQNCPIDQPAKRYQLKYPQVLTKRPPVATTVCSETNTIIEALVYWDLSSDLRSRQEQSHRLQGTPKCNIFAVFFVHPTASRIYHLDGHTLVSVKSFLFIYLFVSAIRVKAMTINS